ncbi:gamma-glutamylcyclotransferase family protein [Motiliproteus sp. SC1-56]|uniref:gamma-glutamylcyclotransferase family protein n=1 Tax=Motiliproteus sp. SC1-56 TaxID=2799565 RepID=UPI001A90905E|nr:gamma-glutamylcyclotransferase family protein [Motiliproteus sp. SC1-56]
MHVFTYGTLMFDPVWSRVVAARYPTVPGKLAGFRRMRVRGDAYPALIPGVAQDVVGGRVYLSVDMDDVLRLDRFEGEQYSRCVKEIQTEKGPLRCAVYVFKPQYLRLVSEHTWEPEWFARRGIHRFLNRYRGFL